MNLKRLKVQELLFDWSVYALATILPRWCPTCGVRLMGCYAVCRTCFNDLERSRSLNYPAASLLRLRLGPSDFDHACAGLEFHRDGGCQRLIHVMKYERRPDLAYDLGHLLAQEFRASDWWRAYDALLPVPLHPRRQRQRGYNQSERIARGIGSVLRLPVRANLVRRVRNTRSQAGLGREQREQNVTDVFAAAPAASGLRLLIVDDVVTTGSTIHSLASSLRIVGVKGMGLIVLADALPE